MRLINVHTLEFEEFFTRNPPAYAILSHRWGPSEITYKDWLKGRNLSGSGYQKIIRFCELVRTGAYHAAVPEYWTFKGLELDEGLQWVWVDTCCIDKRSSAELSEAINSMYSWYKNAAICIVHLADYRNNGAPATARDLNHCEWFWRGWTLQELLAPNALFFCDVGWNIFGYSAYMSMPHDERDLHQVISAITKIPAMTLGDSRYIESASAASRMSWAARRHTTREEDVAYCLLGLFGVNMPLLYGEGSRAFIRLQEEIIKQSGDSTIFAWPQYRTDDSMLDDLMSGGAIMGHAHGMLAERPSNFWLSGSITYAESQRTTPYATTNLGLEMRDELLGTRTDSRGADLYKLLGYKNLPRKLYILRIDGTVEGHPDMADLVLYRRRDSLEIVGIRSLDAQRAHAPSERFSLYLVLLATSTEAQPKLFERRVLVAMHESVDVEAAFEKYTPSPAFYIKK